MRYQMAGMIHILAISGLHISILGMGLFSLLKKIGLGNGTAGLLSLMVMLQYGIFTGGSVSSMRAVCMFVLSVGAKILGRTYDILTALAVSAILLLLDSPAYLYSSSFLLSFGAVVGVAFVSPCIIKIMDIRGKAGKALAGSVAVQLSTLPDHAGILWRNIYCRYCSEPGSASYSKRCTAQRSLLQYDRLYKPGGCFGGSCSRKSTFVVL